jgi:hypothetical protein
MRIAPFIAASVVAIGMTVIASGPSQAAPITPIQKSQINQSSVQQVQYWRHRRWNRCVRWRRICANRWGWGGPRFRRCVIGHGC